MKKVTIILPTYNEKENIAMMIPVLENEIFAKVTDFEMSILVVDDNSPDGTKEVVLEKIHEYGNIRLLTGEKQGLGKAYNRGFDYAIKEMNADAVICMDADFQHNPKYVFDLLDEYDNGSLFVLGSRFVKGDRFPKELGLFRKILSKYGGLLSRMILFFPKINLSTDVSSGFSLIDVKNVLNKIDFTSIYSGFYYKTQILYRAILIGIKIDEIPIDFEIRRSGKTKMPISNVFGTLKAMLSLRLNKNKIKKDLGKL